MRRKREEREEERKRKEEEEREERRRRGRRGRGRRVPSAAEGWGSEPWHLLLRMSTLVTMTTQKPGMSSEILVGAAAVFPPGSRLLLWRWWSIMQAFRD